MNLLLNIFKCRDLHVQTKWAPRLHTLKLNTRLAFWDIAELSWVIKSFIIVCLVMYGSQCLAEHMMLVWKCQSVMSKLIIFPFQEWKYPEIVFKNSLYNKMQLEELPIKTLQAFPLRVQIHTRLRIVMCKIFFHLLVQILQWREWHEALKWVGDCTLAVEYGRERSNLTQCFRDQELPLSLPGCSVMQSWRAPSLSSWSCWDMLTFPSTHTVFSKTVWSACR